MLYIERDSSGKIIGIHNSPTEQAVEKKTAVDQEVIDFIAESGLSDQLQPLLSLFDQSIIRVLDDLIDLLIAKNVIMFTELPEEAQSKITARKILRKKMSNSGFIVDDVL